MNTVHKETLILVPGLLCDAVVWRAQIEVFKERVNILVPDLSTAATPSEMVASVLDEAPDRFALAGHSMGGWVAQL